MALRKFQITVDENVLGGLRDYFEEGVEFLSEDPSRTEELESVKETLAEIDAALDKLYS